MFSDQRPKSASFAHTDSNENNHQLTPLCSRETGWMIEPVNDAIASVQKRRPETFASITRTCHGPGNFLHTSCAACVPIPLLRYARITKNSAISQTASSPRFTRTNPASFSFTRSKNGCRPASDQYKGSDLYPNLPSSPISSGWNSLKS